jgi:hypothetical protein
MAFGGVELVEKARGLPSGAGRDVSDIVDAMQGVLDRQKLQSQFPTSPYPRPPEWTVNQFGPGAPFTPEGLDQPRPDSGQPEPRLWQYPVYWNVQFGKDRHVDWETLKRASETPLFRACIELRKTELSTLDWAIRISPATASALALRQKQTPEKVASDLREQYQAEIDRLTDFWQVPDRKNGRNFSEWISLAADEQLVWDALAIYPRQTYGGDLLDLWIIDGSTIMPLFDQTGGGPGGPAPAIPPVL